MSLQTGSTDNKFTKLDYDVYIWDLEPGQHFSNIYSTVQEVSAERDESF